MSQENPEQLLSAPVCPSPKLPHNTSLFSLKLYSLFKLLPGLSSLKSRRLLASCLCALAALPASTIHVDLLPCTLRVSLIESCCTPAPKLTSCGGTGRQVHATTSALLLLPKLGSSSSHKREKLTRSMMHGKLPSFLREEASSQLPQILLNGYRLGTPTWTAQHPPCAH